MQCERPTCVNVARQRVLVDAVPVAHVCSQQCGWALLGMPRRPYDEDNDEDIQAAKRIPAATEPPSDATLSMLRFLPLKRKPAAASSSSSSAAASSSSSSSSSSYSMPPKVPPPASSSSSSSSAATVAPASSADAPRSSAAVRPTRVYPVMRATDEREPVARTLAQVYGISPALADKLGFTVYRLVDAGDSEPAMRALLAPAYGDRATDLDVATQHALSWVRRNRDFIASWRAAHPDRVLPDPARPSGWLQDVPGLNPSLTNAATQAALNGIGTLDKLLAYYRANGAVATRRQLELVGYVHGRSKVNLDRTLAYLASLS